jgi:hypothetical protein
MTTGTVLRALEHSPLNVEVYKVVEKMLRSGTVGKCYASLTLVTPIDIDARM